MTDNDSFVIFSPSMGHDDIARGNLYGKPVSAGFCTIMAEQGGDTGYANVHCYGKSVSLKLESREVDEEIINRKISTY